MKSKYAKYQDEILELAKSCDFKAHSVAWKIAKKHKFKRNGAFTDYCRRTIEKANLIGRELNDNGITSDAWDIAWIKTKNGSYRLKKSTTQTLQLFDEILKDVKKFAPKINKIKRKQVNDPHLLVIDPADIHIGKLSDAFETGDEYNSEIACQRVIEGVNGILQKSAPYNIDKILFIAGNDVLHTDTPRNSTTSGTPQDVSEMWYQSFIKAKDLYIKVIETLLGVADVTFVYNPSNHDYTNGFFLSQVIEAYFSKCENITFDISPKHRKYYRYHNNIIGTTHGDGAKEKDLPLLMAHECKYWTECKYRYFYTHHLHHKVSKDYMSVTIETMRSPSGSDSWHHRNGYQHAPKAIEGFIHNKEYGQVSRLTHYF